MPPVIPVATPAESASTLESEPKPEVSPKAKVTPGGKRKRSRVDAGGPPAKKILGDGTRSPDTPVTWKSSSTGIVIKSVNELSNCLEEVILFHSRIWSSVVAISRWRWYATAWSDLSLILC